jgi:hypothetical protein
MDIMLILYLILYLMICFMLRGTGLWHYATSRKVAGSISYEVIDFLQLS